MFVAGNPVSVEGEPPLLAHFKFDGNGADASGQNPDMELGNATFTNNTLLLPNGEYYVAVATIAGLSYQSFTVAFDFRPCGFEFPHSTLLSGGPGYRWIEWGNDSSGRLMLTLNNSTSVHAFTNVLTSDHWHTLVSSVDLVSGTIATVLDGERLGDITMSNFQFQVVGTEFEQSDKAFTFVNQGNLARLCGLADNLRIYSRALTEEELTGFFAPKVAVIRFDRGAVIHWPADLTGFVLEVATSLPRAINWQMESRAPIEIGDRRLVIETLVNGSRFYRLRRL